MPNWQARLNASHFEPVILPNDTNMPGLASGWGSSPSLAKKPSSSTLASSSHSYADLQDIDDDQLDDQSLIQKYGGLLYSEDEVSGDDFSALKSAKDVRSEAQTVSKLGAPIHQFRCQ